MSTTILGVEFLTAPEVAERLGVENKTVHNWIQGGLFIDVIDRGKRKRLRYLVPATSLDGFVPPSHRAGHVRGRRAGEKRSGGEEEKLEPD